MKAESEEHRKLLLKLFSEACKALSDNTTSKSLRNLSRDFIAKNPTQPLLYKSLK